MRTSRLRVTLREVTPRVLRVIDVPASSTLPELHELLQVALGWANRHLHVFAVGKTTYGIPDDEIWDDHRDEARVRLRDLPASFVYTYDFGDCWDHDVEVLGGGNERPGCVYGEGACPPEDCGGPDGYGELLAALADPEHEDHEYLRTWAGELADFDQAATDLLLRQTVGEVPASVRLLLDLTEDGIALTPGGRLPRAVVRQVQQLRPSWAMTGRPAAIEDGLPSLVALIWLLRRAGVLRLHKGILAPTRAAGDELEVVRRIRAWFARETFTELLAGLTVATVASAGPASVSDLAARVYARLGPRWVRDGRPLTERDVCLSISRLGTVLSGLDQVEFRSPLWHPGPSARWLLPRATALIASWAPASVGIALAGEEGG